MHLNSKNTLLGRTLLLGASSIAALCLGAPASAQDTGVETVVVTGSRIPQQGLFSSSPVTAVGQEDLKLQGVTSVAQALHDLPSTVGDSDNQFRNNGSGGIATVDLRGLGNTRTLVLVNGKRMVASDTGGDVDLNQIPPIMIERTEILTGGASAVYGADAVAGVVNLILRKDFEGLEVDTQYKQTDHNDGQVFEGSILLGANSASGKGNITVYGDYQNRQPILQGSRDYSQVALKSSYLKSCPTSIQIWGGFCPSGSTASAEGNFLGKYSANSNGTFDPVLTVYNFNPMNYYMTPNTRYAFGANGHYDVNKHFEVYGRLTYSDNSSTDQLAPTPIISTFKVNYGNPYLSSQERQILFGSMSCYATNSCDPVNTTSSFGLQRRLVENGNRVHTFDYSAYQMVIGVRGDLLDNWTYDISAQYGHVADAERYTGDAQFNAFQQGLLVTGTAANPICINTSNNCVPINIFKSGAISQAAVNFFTLQMTKTGYVSQWDMQANVVGDLGQTYKSPWAKNPIGVSLGSEYRQEQAAAMPDQNLATGQDLGFGQSGALKGSYNVSEAYTEVQVPVVEGMPFAQLISLDGAYRYSSYSLSGSTNTYKYSGEWAPTDDLRFRGSFERAVRAPNIAELFGPLGVSADSGNDPCSAQTGGVVTTRALCQATMPTNATPAAFANIFTSALNCPSGQCTSRTGGNVALKPEKANTRSVGVVLTPRFIPGFDTTIDWYDIGVQGFITNLPLETVLNLCYSQTYNPSQSAANPYCQMVHRNAAGEIFGQPVPPGGSVAAQLSNIANYNVAGYDFESNYTSDFSWAGMPSGYGSLSLNFRGTYTTKSDYQASPVTSYLHCDGLFGKICPNGAPTPDWRHTLRVSYLSPQNDFTVSVLWRHISSVRDDQVVLSNLYDPLDARIPAYDWFDLSGTWNVNDKFTLRAGVSNLFGKRPPLIDYQVAASSVDSGNTFPGTYDAVGRFIFIGATARL